ncbi:unnamed protein product [Hymenolepis diminuta]|uniref:Integrase_H2C2 domain-containing protein n=1 Tax=Hymenolepis diminuta TaxID=6216 RepID=A0A0R3SPR2_HYMDI|nr:unnamed protein product [Hymenolepis diminuta]
MAAETTVQRFPDEGRGLCSHTKVSARPVFRLKWAVPVAALPMKCPDEETVIASLTMEDTLQRLLFDAVPKLPKTNFYDRVVIPLTSKRAILQQFPCSHPDINRMKSIERTFAYWLRMDRAIEAVAQRCSKCQQAIKLPHTTKLLSDLKLQLHGPTYTWISPDMLMVSHILSR